MAITTTTDLNSLYNTIHEDALFVARESNIMVGLVRTFSATGYMQRKGAIRPQVTAVEKPEGVDFQNPTTFGRTEKYTLTPTVKMAQALLTDEDLQTDPSNAAADCAFELGSSLATKIDVDLVTLFASFTSGKGSAGNALSIAKCAAGVSLLRTNKTPNPLYFVLHPYGWHDVWTELGQPTANQAFLGDIANQALRSFFVGAFLSATWFTSANIDIDDNADAVGGVFSPQALGFDEREAPVLEPERDASRKATEMNMSAGYAVGVLRDEYGCKLTHDATEPTG
ncbi:MAG TPA: hypothetical protein PK530_00275 [Anaerolineales bacterium]|nr:hypothetical protein [Anaerolineales bacterium]